MDDAAVVQGPTVPSVDEEIEGDVLMFLHCLAPSPAQVVTTSNADNFGALLH